jgi:hypothetical protein
MKTRLNVATAPLESNRRFAVGAASVGIVGLAAMFLLAGRAYSVWRADTDFRAEQAQIEVDMSQLRAERSQLEQFFGRPETVQKRELAGFLNGLIAQRSFPWTRIFMNLESSLPGGVRVVSIEPKLVDDHLELRLTVGASSDEGKLKFLRALEGSGEFSDIEVLDERRSGRPTDADPILLQLQARYSAS